MTVVRPMRLGDESQAEAAWDAAIRALMATRQEPAPSRTPELIDQAQRRVTHLLATDPGGSWVVESDGEIVGVAQAHIRGGTWVLATLGVVPEHQESGMGRRLLDRALSYGDPVSPGAIFSSSDPRAIHRYMSAGFAMHPAAAAYGPPRKPVSRQPGVRHGDLHDLEIVNAVDREIRGSTRASDIEFQLSLGYQLLVEEEGGYAVIRRGRIATLAALNEDIATRLLVDSVSRCSPDDPVDVGWMTSRQQWALRSLTLAGVPLRVRESIMTRGSWEPERPYLPNGIFG